MKRITFIMLALLVFQFGFSQAEKLLMGKVIDKDFPVQSVDVVNYTTQKSTVTNREGIFYIEAKPNDVIFFYHKNHYDKKIILNQKDADSDSFIIELIFKPVELDEVVIQKNQSNEFKITESDIDERKFIKEYERPKVVGSYDGSMPYGVDLLGLGIGAIVGTVKVVKNIFNIEKKATQNKEIEFKEYVDTNFKQDFFITQLKLKPSEIPLFIDFCDADPKSKTISSEVNILAMTDFLLAKNIEFKKNLQEILSVPARKPTTLSKK